MRCLASPLSEESKFLNCTASLESAPLIKTCGLTRLLENDDAKGEGGRTHRNTHI
ncbi:hypothetical protein P175DRAFT_0499676 [Aspergillus ochraceoroseus IBT 24754]|uniref:Uncharacterized protein n=1 Tax=Aspergillus ochraceoroseus IBT 24754 TaxID=1392256 RepID=A0A2T5M3K1_9EURO|nr:uncharacterized protein P175DRAFT_0499676 [Aspergillus ochraceoroseus IBT 24754]PTU23121.1 hypothetical protein P175DRAFT_0499676 [Aspergillus ochraceoroseus IBT 24754]